MWSKLGIDPSEIWNELDKRMKKPKIKKKIWHTITIIFLQKF
jgi:hypothetical protein